MPLPRSALAFALAIATTPAFAADNVTVEDLARRLKALELRLGTAETPSTPKPPTASPTSTSGCA